MLALLQNVVYTFYSYNQPFGAGVFSLRRLLFLLRLIGLP